MPTLPTATDSGLAELNRQLVSLNLSEVEPRGASEAIQAAAWWNMLARLGIRPPLVVVHDLGLLLAQGRRAADGTTHGLAPAARAPLTTLRLQYRTLLSAVLSSDLAHELRATAPRDETIAVVLARVLADVYLRWPGAPRRGGTEELPLLASAYELAALGPRASTGPGSVGAAGVRAGDAGWAVPFLQRLVENERPVLARLDQIDLSALRLLGLFSVEGGLPDLVDLYQVVGAIGTADIVDFSLQLLPSLLETKRRRSVQRFAIDGYASIERRGSIDALLPSELAHDEDVFLQKALSDDLLFYARERAPDAGRRLNLLLVDSSASMRGSRQVFARGLALALCKKLSLLGGEVWLRFFDSRLHERLDVGRAPGRDLPRLLSFRSERGRNYPRVFGDLAADVARLRREEGRDVAVTFITHAECHIPAATVEALARDASLYGIFVLPSRALTLGYLPLLHRYQIVTAETLARAASSRRRALEIVEDAARAAPPVGGGARRGDADA